jgi:3'(2'),5'-bisphosphate nucleotidase
MQASDIEIIAIAAGDAIMAFRERGYKKDKKADGSPVTDADLAADDIINQQLTGLTPDLPRITEETWQGTDRGDEPREYWCVDPLDGTKGFINGSRDFTVNISLIRNRYPVLGVIYAPALGRIWAGSEGAAWMRETPAPTASLTLDDFGGAVPINVRAAKKTHPVIITTKSHRSVALDDWISRLHPVSDASVGSSLKFCKLAEGKADLYPRISPTMEWDTAAGQAILEAAGGTMIGADGTRFSYGKAGRLNGTFAAMADIKGSVPDAWHPPQEITHG